MEARPEAVISLNPILSKEMDNYDREWIQHPTPTITNTINDDNVTEISRIVCAVLEEFQGHKMGTVQANKGSLEQWLSQARKFGGAAIVSPTLPDKSL